MSGGSYDYAYARVNDFADELARRAKTPECRAFHLHLRLVADAMKAVEWEDSGDTGPEETAAALAKVLTVPQVIASEAMHLRAAIDDAQAALLRLEGANSPESPDGLEEPTR